MQIVEDVTVPEFGRLLRKIFVLSFPYLESGLGDEERARAPRGPDLP